MAARCHCGINRSIRQGSFTSLVGQLGGKDGNVVSRQPALLRFQNGLEDGPLFGCAIDEGRFGEELLDSSCRGGFQCHFVVDVKR